ncbi:MAG: cytochrome c3 family protein, partial [Pyrinomonadaceae bacterium]
MKPARSLTLPICASVLLFAAICTLASNAGAQRRKTQRTPTPRSRPTRIDYSHFSHATRQHQGACNTCHKTPTDNWKKVRDYPDVADFPGHDACVSCHRAQFFKGAKPTICSDCHSKVSPRDDARFPFRNPAGARQFVTEFPHDKHQDVIAK